MNYPLTIVIPTAGNRPDLLKRALASLARCELPAAYSETLVIENGGRQGAEKIASESSSVLKTRYMFVGQANKSAALNAALDTLADGFIVFLDDDVRVSPNLITDYAVASNRHGPGHVFGGPVRCDYEEPPPGWLLPHLPCSAKGWSLPDPSAADHSFFLGFNWAAFVSDLVTAGGFDPNRGPGASTHATGQETAMQQRLREQGAKAVYLPNARVWHHIPSGVISWRWAVRRAYRDGVGQMLDEANRNDYLWGLPRYNWRCLWLATRNAILALPTLSRSRLCRSWLDYQRLRGARYAQQLIHRGIA